MVRFRLHRAAVAYASVTRRRGGCLPNRAVQKIPFPFPSNIQFQMRPSLVSGVVLIIEARKVKSSMYYCRLQLMKATLPMGSDL